MKDISFNVTEVSSSRQSQAIGKMSSSSVDPPLSSSTTLSFLHYKQRVRFTLDFGCYMRICIALYCNAATASAIVSLVISIAQYLRPVQGDLGGVA